jgi:hypothetical protein
VQIGTCTGLDLRAGSDAPVGQFIDPHPQLTDAKPIRDPPHDYRLPSLIYVGAIFFSIPKPWVA